MDFLARLDEPKSAGFLAYILSLESGVSLDAKYDLSFVPERTKPHARKALNAFREREKTDAIIDDNLR